MQRRHLLRLGVVSGLSVALAGAGFALLNPGLSQGRLTPPARAAFAAVARAVLDGSVPASAPASAAFLDGHLARLEATIGAMPPSMQDEIGQLATLLANAPTRRLLTGLAPDWSTATTPEVAQMLQHLRLSSWPVRQQIYHALRDLTSAAHYASPAAWAEIGYPGPMPV